MDREQVLPMASADIDAPALEVADRAWKATPVQDASPAAALTLLAEALSNDGATRKTEALWNWKHRDSPFGPSAGLAATSSSGELIGLRPFMRWSLRGPGGYNVDAARPVDTVTDTRWRRSGIFSRLTIEGLAGLEQDGVRLVYNTPNSNSLPGNLKLGWASVGRMQFFLGLCRPLRIAAAMRSRTIADAQFAHPQITDSASIRNPQVLEAVTSLAAESEYKRGYRGYRTARTAKYLAWRYAAHPHVDYGVYQWREKSVLEAAVVYRLERRRGLTGCLISDIFLRSGGVRHGYSLLKGLARSLGVDYVFAHAGLRAPERRILMMAGMIPLPGKGIRLAARPLAKANHLPLDPASPRSWDLTMSELELF